MQEENVYAEHEVNVIKLIGEYIKPYGTILSSEPVNKYALRINFIQKDADESWLQDLDEHLKRYRDAGILAAVSFKYAAEWTEDVRYGALTVMFNPVWSQEFCTTWTTKN